MVAFIHTNTRILVHMRDRNAAAAAEVAAAAEEARQGAARPVVVAVLGLEEDP